MSQYNKEKLYFTKTPINFYYRDNIQWLISQENGYEIIFLYNQLIGLTANKNGYLRKDLGELTEPYSVEDISKITMHDLSIVVKGIELLEKIGMIEKHNDQYFIPEALEMTNQTVSAYKKQLQRKADKCPPNCPPDIDIEIEKELDLEQDNRIKNIEERNTIDLDEENRNLNWNLYCSFLHLIEEKFDRNLGKREEDELKEIVSYFEEKDIVWSIDRAVKNQKMTVGYVKGILEHLESGFTYQEMAEKNY